MLDPKLLHRPRRPGCGAQPLGAVKRAGAFGTYIALQHRIEPVRGPSAWALQIGSQAAWIAPQTLPDDRNPLPRKIEVWTVDQDHVPGDTEFAVTSPVASFEQAGFAEGGDRQRIREKLLNRDRWALPRRR